MEKDFSLDSYRESLHYSVLNVRCDIADLESALEEDDMLDRYSHFFNELIDSYNQLANGVNYFQGIEDESNDTFNKQDDDFTLPMLGD